MRKCIHGQVRPCHYCKHDYDRAAPYVVDDPPESLQRCYAVIERLQSQLDQSQKMQLKHKQQADIAVAKVAELRAEIELCHSIILNGTDSPDKLAYVFEIPTSTGEDWDEAVDKLMEGTRCRT